MCFSANASIITFIIGVVGSLCLIKYGNTKYYKFNLEAGIFFIFIAGIQFMDFLFWIDLKNKIGINKITTIIGPLFNIGQPFILYLVKLIINKPKNILSMSNFNLPVLILNVMYFINLMIGYKQFLKEGNLTTGTSNGHLLWPWIKYSNSNFYLIVLAINIFYLMAFNYALTLFLITYFFLLLSVIFFSYNTGELWCFFGAFIPFIMIFVSYYI